MEPEFISNQINVINNTAIAVFNEIQNGGRYGNTDDLELLKTMGKYYNYIEGILDVRIRQIEQQLPLIESNGNVCLHKLHQCIEAINRRLIEQPFVSDESCENEEEITDPVTQEIIPTGRGFKLEAEQGRCYDADTVSKIQNNIGPLTRNKFSMRDVIRKQQYIRATDIRNELPRTIQRHTPRSPQEAEDLDMGGGKARTKKGRKRKNTQTKKRGAKKIMPRR